MFPSPDAAATSAKAVCILRPDGDSGVSGVVEFLEEAGTMTITATVSGLTTGKVGAANGCQESCLYACMRGCMHAWMCGTGHAQVLITCAPFSFPPRHAARVPHSRAGRPPPGLPQCR